MASSCWVHKLLLGSCLGSQLAFAGSLCSRSAALLPTSWSSTSSTTGSVMRVWCNSSHAVFVDNAFPQLQWLGLRHNGMCDAGGRSLADAIVRRDC